ncbi:MAG: YfhO family protein [Desulfobacterales bacterium]
MFPIQHQLELMFSIKTGSFPLFVPGFSGGQSSSALTLSQIYHPISHIASILPDYWNGKALEWNTFLRLLSLGLAQFSLFFFLRCLKVGTAAAFVLSVIAVYNLRMLDLFRYGASLESWTGFIFLFSTIGTHYLRPTSFKSQFLIICSTYWLVCSGHPQMMYYSLCGAALFVLVLPYFVATLPNVNQNEFPTMRRFWIQVAASVLAGILLASAYIAPFYFEFLADNAGRVGRDYNFAVSFVDTFLGTVNNFIQPLRSDVHGAFGGSSLFLVAAFVPLLKLFRIKIPGVIWCIWGMALLVFLHMQGPRTSVHYLTWNYFPLASSVRIPGRLSLILPLLFLLLLIWVLKIAGTTIRIAGRDFKLSSKEILAAFSIVAIGIYLILPETINNDHTEYSATVIRNIPSWIEPTAMTAGVAGIIVFALFKDSNRSISFDAILLGLFVCAQVSFLLAFGTWVVPKTETDPFSTFLNEKKKDLNYRHLPGSGLYSRAVMQHVKKTNLEPYLAKFYTSVIPASDMEDDYRLIQMDRRPHQVIIEGCPDCENWNSVPSGSGNSRDVIELSYSSYNRLEFTADVSRDGFFTLAYPYSGRWTAFVDGRNVPVYRGNGAAHAVKVQSGKSRIEFRYRSRAAVGGMLVSCLTIALIGISFCVITLRKPVNIIGGVIAVATGIALFTVWNQSLYNGDNLETAYVWYNRGDRGPLNLAYGKPTNTSRIVRETYPNYFYSDQFLTFNNSGKAVDGNRKTGSGFFSNLEEKPYWYVDLHRPRAIGSLVLYENKRKQHWNKRPLLVGLSDNGKKWRTAAVISNSDGSSKLTVNFKPVENARFVLLQSAKYCRLALDEIEVYPPSNE